MKTQPIFFLALFLFPFFVSAQCMVDAGSDTTYCAPNFNTHTYSLTTGVMIQNGTAPYTYEWSTSYQHTLYGLLTASDFLDDTTAASPEIIEFIWDYADSMGLNALPFYLKVTDAMGQTCRDTIEISYTHWGVTLDDCVFWVPRGTTVSLRAKASGELPPYTFDWSPSYGLSDSTIWNPSLTVDSSMVYTVTVTDKLGCRFQNDCTIYIEASSIDDLQDGRLFYIAPNPVRTSGIIKLNYLPFQDAQAEILDLTGKVVFSQAFTSDRIEFSSKNLSKGIYICRIKDSNSLLATRKFIVTGE